VGIMSVVEDVDKYTGDEPEPTWDEAVAAFETATPVELVRPRRHVTVVYRYADGSFTATSPDLTGFGISGRSLRETIELVKQDLAGFLDPAVEILERFPDPEPEIVTTAVSQRWSKVGPLPGVVLVSSRSASRAFVSSTRASLRQVRA
jgi:hypothetical protein